MGSAGIAPGANVGAHGAIFEPGTRHVCTELAGKNTVNPTGVLLSGVQMLRYLKFPVFADRMEAAVFDTIASGIKTKDVGGSASTSQFVDAIISKVDGSQKAKSGDKKSKGVSKAL